MTKIESDYPVDNWVPIQAAFHAGFDVAQDGAGQCCGCNCGDPYIEWEKYRAREEARRRE